MARRKATRTQKIRQFSRKHSFLVELSMVVILFGIGVLLLPVHQAHGIDYSPTPTDKQSLGEDTLVACTAPQIITHGSRDTKEIALTFDADMTVWMNNQLHSGAVKSYINRDLINVLINTQTPATLFLTGMWIKDYPQDTQLLANNPLFELANHSYSHPSFNGYCYGLPQMGSISLHDQIMLTQKLLKQYTGVDNTYFRFPGGCTSPEALQFLQDNGIQTIHWDVVGDDGFNDNVDAIVHNVVDHVQNGSIIVMHMNGAPNDPKTSEALPTIIATLKNEGYTFVKVSDLLAQ